MAFLQALMLLLLAVVLLQVSGDKELQLTDKYCTLRHVAGRWSPPTSIWISYQESPATPPEAAVFKPGSHCQQSTDRPLTHSGKCLLVVHVSSLWLVLISFINCTLNSTLFSCAQVPVTLESALFWLTLGFLRIWRSPTWMSTLSRSNSLPLGHNCSSSWFTSDYVNLKINNHFGKVPCCMRLHL